jgi:hypothetical protein
MTWAILGFTAAALVAAVVVEWSNRDRRRW